MLSIGRLGPGGGSYYTHQVASGAEDYYLGSGEAPGRWTGSGLDQVDLETGSVVDPEAFARILDGCHPDTGDRLVPAGAGRVQGLDLTFSAPKSVSLLWALHPDPNVRQTVAAAHDRAVTDAISFLESDAVAARRGHNGTERVGTAGLIAAGFAHRSSRAGDPQLHTHLVAANLVRGSDGRFSALDTRAVYRHARTAGYLYQARLRHELTRTLGVTWDPVRSGQADLAGLDRTTLEAFSTRRAEIVDALEERGLSSANAARVATLDTRPAKADPAVGVGLFERWQTEAAALGVDVSGLACPGREPESPGSQMIHDLVGPGGLTARASSFDRRDLLRALASAHPEGATLERLEHLAREITGQAATVELTGEGTDVAARRWTTVDLLATEADLLRLADRNTSLAAGVASSAAVDAALEAQPQLTEEQRDLVTGVSTSRAGVVVIVGKAGTGKTFTLDACRAAWEATGTTVIGAALSARAAAELQAGAGIASTTLARLVADLGRPESRPPAGTVIVIDEAGMVGTRQLHTLAQHAARHNWKLVLAGDPRQLPEIDAGGAFTALAGRVPTWTLTINIRQAETWERQALDRLRDHQPAPAVAAYQRHGRVTIAETAAAARQAMIADWHHEHSGGASTVMLAVRRADVAALNTAAQAIRVAAGEVDPATAVEVGGRWFMVGDEAICTRNDRRARLTNGTRLTITHLNPQQHHIEGRTPDGQKVMVGWDYADAGQLQLGYALTVHRSQGATVDHAFLLGDDRLFAEAGYVGLSRARHTNQLYTVASPAPPAPSRSGARHRDIDGIVAALGVSQAQAISTSHAHPDPHLAGRPLRDLVEKRDQLLEAICADMPPDPSGRLAVLDETRKTIQAAPAGAPWITDAKADLDRQASLLAAQVEARHAWAAGHRHEGQLLARLTATIDQLARHTSIDPPAEIIELLGPPPGNPVHRPAWADAAGKIAVWAEISGQPINQLLAGPGPDRGAERDWWNQARTALQHHRLELDRIGLDRHQKGLTI